MKPFLVILAVTVALSSSALSADEDIRGLGKVKVSKVMYVRDGEFYVTLSMTPTPATETKPLFFNNEPTLSFQFRPDKLNGICVIATPDQVITRRDVALLGPSFINLLLSKMTSGQALDLSCGFTQTKSDRGIESGKYVLSYFQVNRVNE